MGENQGKLSNCEIALCNALLWLNEPISDQSKVIQAKENLEKGFEFLNK